MLQPVRTVLRSILWALALGLLSCVAEGGEVGDYCREDRDCREGLVCLANACRAPAFDAGS